MNLRKGINVASLGALLLAGTALIPSAQAEHVTLECGQNVTTDVTLTSDIGPCTGDGLVVTTDGVTINLDGYTITGSNTTNNTGEEQAGIHLIGVSDVTVQGRGTITNFDAGVAIEEGSNNTVARVSAVENINHSALTGASNPCNFGDGIVIFDSSDNVIRANLLENNGPYDGVALVGDSDRNTIRDNRALNNRSLNVLPDGSNGPCGPFQGTGEGPGRPDQNIGIRIEGPGSDDNMVSSNIVDNNLLNGISINGNVIAFPPGIPLPPQPTNTGNSIVGNTVTNNGFGPIAEQDGIAVLRQGPFGTVVGPAQNTTIVGNTVTGNARHGILMPALTSNNKINRNLVNDNGVDGILVQGPFTICPPGQGNPAAPGGCNVPREERAGSENNTLIGNRGMGNGEHDGHDGNPDCDENRWIRNIFGTVNQPCVSATATVPPVGGAAAAADSAESVEPEPDELMSSRPSRS